MGSKKKNKSTKQNVSMILTRNDILALSNILNRISYEISGKEYPLKFIYKLAKIKKVIDDEAQSYREMQQDIYQLIADYERERVELLHKYGEKDEKGNLIFEGQNVKIPPDKDEEFRKEIDELQMKYKDKIELFEKRMKEYQDFLNEEVEISIPKITINELPNKLPLNVNEMQVFSLIIFEN